MAKSEEKIEKVIVTKKLNRLIIISTLKRSEEILLFGDDQKVLKSMKDLIEENFE